MNSKQEIQINVNDKYPKASVIVPIYNGALFIPGLLKIFANQTFKDFELIFIDDGSKDNSLELLLSSAKTLKETGQKQIPYQMVVVHQNNAGQGTARNTGIEYSRGTYLLFVDQDDYIKENYLEELIYEADRKQCDILLSGYDQCFPDGKIKDHVVLHNAAWCRFMCIAPWGKVYRSSFIKGNNILFSPCVLGEDVFFNLICYSKSNNVSFTEYVGYRWVINPSSLSRTEHHIFSDENSLLPVYKLLGESLHFSEIQKDPNFEYFFIKTAIYHILTMKRELSYLKIIAYERELFYWISEYFPNYLHNPNLALGRPDGERMSTSLIVLIYMKLYELGISGVLLRLLFKRK